MKREVERELEAAALCEQYATVSTGVSREIYLRAQERHLDDAMAAACEPEPLVPPPGTKSTQDPGVWASTWCLDMTDDHPDYNEDYDG